MSIQSNQHWTYKYHPENLSDVVGHFQGIKILKEWLRKFQTDKTKKAPPIIFIYGASGIGKTTIATLLLQQFNYHIFELNAGEIRSKKRIQEMMEKILANYSVNMMKKKHRQQDIGIVMDEIDGMSCGDKGGLHQLFSMIQEQYDKKQVINPVICISNRSYDKKLASYLYTEVALRRPSSFEIIKYLKNICIQENIKIEDTALQILIQYTNQDVRKTINFLQEVVFFFNQSHMITIEDIQHIKDITRKTRVDYNIFDVTQTIFSRKHTFLDIYDFYKVDSNLIPMMIHENLPSRLQHKKIPSKNITAMYQYLMHYLTISDIILKFPRWELSYSHSMLTCGYANEYLGSIATKNIECPKTQFTNTLTKSATHSNTQIFLSLLSYKLNIDSRYFPYIFPIILHQITEEPSYVKNYNINYSDIEKISQIYLKWILFRKNLSSDINEKTSENKCSTNYIKITPKHKKLWKKNLN